MKTRLGILLAVLLTFVGAPIATMAQSATTGTLTGTVRSGGAPVSGAQIVVTGQVKSQTTTDAHGAFTIANLPAGFYRLDVNKGGYVPASLENIAILATETETVSVNLEQADLTSLRTIARVTTSAHSSINLGAAAVGIATREQFVDLASPQINDVVQRIPGANVEHGSSSPNTSISLAGAQGYETQVLLDGHPLSAGRYGVWFSQYFNPALIQSIETQVGPGNTTPFAGTAVGGTANIVTPGFTSKPTGEFIVGSDQYGSQYSSFLNTGKFDKLSYVIGGGVAGANGPFYQKNGCVVNPATKSKWNTPGATAVIQFCGDLSGSLYNKGEVAKLKYDFSPSTSLEAGFIGAQGGFLPQGTSYGIDAGMVTIVNCLTPTNCSNPAYKQYIGQTIHAYSFYPGSNVHNNQPLFEAQLRTAIRDNTLLVRPYAGNIGRIIDGSGEANYPSTFLANGTIVPQGPFSVLEFDKLKGTTVSFIHPFGENTLTGTYDTHSDETFAYYNDPSNVSVPDTTAKFNTLSLTGDFQATQKLRVKAGLYDTAWKLAGSQPGPIVFVGGVAQQPQLVPLSRTVSRVDPHLSFILTPHSGLSYRLAVGTSTTFPYSSLVSGQPSLVPPSASGNSFYTLNEKSPTLSPERASEVNLGLDNRFHDGSILSLDLTSTNVSNVFETLTYDSGTQINGTEEFVNAPINAANLNSKFASVTYRKDVNRGLGWYLSGTLARSVPNGIPLAAYGKNPTLPANGIQQCSDGGSSVCIPYFKAYGALSFTGKDGTYYKLGEDFEGKNNTYFQPPFAIFDAVVRHPVRDSLDAQLSISNLLNTNSYGDLVLPNAGTPVLGENNKGQYGNYVGSTPFALIPVQPRNVRLQLRWHVNR